MVPWIVFYVLGFMHAVTIASHDQPSAKHFLVCTSCNNKVTLLKYPKPSIRLNCNISELRCKCSNHKCVKGSKFSLSYCDISEPYKSDHNITGKLAKVCTNLGCKRFQVTAIVKSKQMAHYPIAYRDVLHPGMFKTTNRKAPVVKAKMKSKEYCWRIEPKGRYVLVPERTTSKTTSKRSKASSKGNTRRIGVKATGKMSVTRKVIGKNQKIKIMGKEKESRMWTKRRERMTTKKKFRGHVWRTSKRFKSVRTTGKKNQLRQSSTTHKSGVKSKKITSQTTKSRKQKKLTSKRKHSATPRRKTKKLGRTTKRFRKSSRTIARSIGKNTKTTKKLSRAKTKKRSTRRPPTRKAHAKGSSTKSRNKPTTVKNRRTSRRRQRSTRKGKSKEAHRTSRKKKGTTRKFKHRITRKGARKSKCKGNRTKQCDDPLHRETGYVSSACVPRNRTVDVELSCSKCHGRDEKILMPAQAHARNLTCRKFYIICNCPGGHCDHETDHLIPLCDLSNLGQENIDQLKSACVASGCEYFQVRSHSPLEHVLAYYNGHVREGWSPVEQKWNTEQKRLSDYCGNRSEGFERAPNPPTCREKEYKTFNGCKIPDQRVRVNASCTGCRNFEEFVSLSDRFECTLVQDACQCRSASCRAPELMEYVYIAYCIAPQGQTDGYLEKCRLAGCNGGIQARTDHRDYYLFYDGQKLLKGRMRYRGQSTKTLLTDYAIDDYCSIQLNPGGYTLVEHPKLCIAQDYTKSQVYCESCNGNTSERIASDGPPIHCVFSNYACDSFYGSFLLHYCDMQPENGTQTWRIDKYLENCKSKNCLYVSVYSDRDKYEREIIAFQGVFCPGLLKVTRDVSVPVRDRDQSVENMCQHVGGENRISIFARPFCSHCGGNVSSWRPATKPDGRLADQIECRMRAVRCNCRNEAYCNDGSVTHRVCVTGTWKNDSPPCCPVEVDVPIETQYPGLVNMCSSLKCAAIQVAGAWPVDESWRLLTDRFQLFPGVWKPVDSSTSQYLDRAIAFDGNFCGPACAGNNKTQSRIVGPKTQTPNVPIVCTYCNGSLNATAKTGFTANCYMQRVDCPCFDTFTVEDRVYYEKSANVCNLDIFGHIFDNVQVKQWRDHCRSIGCAFTQALLNTKPYILYSNKMMYPGKAIEPRNQFNNPRLTLDEAYFLLPKQMNTTEYCARLQLDKNTASDERLITVSSPKVWLERPVLVCSSCAQSDKNQYPSIGLVRMPCDVQASKCDCNFGSTDKEEGICVEYLPYCKLRQGATNSSDVYQRMCAPECSTYGASIGAMHVPILIDTLVIPSRVISPNASFLMRSGVDITDYCKKQAEYGLLKIPNKESVTGFLLCTHCGDDKWAYQQLATRVTCTIEKMKCECPQNCTCADCKYTSPAGSGSVVPHCLPLCSVGDQAYWKYFYECQANGCQRPQLIYNSDWYLMTGLDVISPGVYKFRLYGSMRKLDTEHMANPK